MSRTDEVLYALKFLREKIAFLPRSLRLMCESIVDDLRFQTAPGGVSHHHNYEGGLAIHTAEVLGHALRMTDPENPCDDIRIILTVATVFHDFHKIYEYKIEHAGSVTISPLAPDVHSDKIEITKLPYRELIGHVAGGFWEFKCAMMAINDVSYLPEDFELRVAHCLLSHHGRLEWRSPVEPRTLEAHILHAADMLSARP